MRRIFVGVDPGLSGAMAVLSEGAQAQVWDTPTLQVGSRRDYNVPAMCRLLQEYCPSQQTLLCLERSQAFPGMGRVASFGLGKGYGIWLGLAGALGLAVELIRPQVWKQQMLGAQKDKQASLQRAIQLWPYLEPELNLKKHEGRAEALLIAEFGRRIATKGALLYPQRGVIIQG